MRALFLCLTLRSKCENPPLREARRRLIKSSERKIKKYAFSGGQETLEEQRQLGGNPDVDVAYQYLSFFTDNDNELKSIEIAYRKGEMLTSELKKKCIAKLQAFVEAFQTRRAAIGDAVVDEFMRVRPLVWGNKDMADLGDELSQPTPNEPWVSRA